MDNDTLRVILGGKGHGTLVQVQTCGTFGAQLISLACGFLMACGVKGDRKSMHPSLIQFYSSVFFPTYTWCRDLSCVNERLVNVELQVRKSVNLL